MRSLALASLGLAVFAYPRLAHATSHYRFLYVREAGAERCPEEMSLRMAVVARLGYDPFSPNASGALFASIRLLDGKLSGSVELVDENGISRGRRQLQALYGCDEMARALALSISIAIDPESTEPRRERSANPPPARSAAPRPLPPLPAEETAPAQRRADLPTRRISSPDSVALSAITLIGMAPSAAVGGALWYEHARGPFAFVGGARFAIAPSGDVRAGADLKATLVASDLGLCWRRSLLEACGVGLAGASWVTGGQVRSPRTSAGPFLAFGARLALAAPLSNSAGVFAAGEAWGVATPVHAEVDGVRVWDAPTWAAGLLLGARLRFP
jgi:hypothetical protein